jgi:hypothetical protein
MGSRDRLAELQGLESVVVEQVGFVHPPEHALLLAALARIQSWTREIGEHEQKVRLATQDFQPSITAVEELVRQTNMLGTQARTSLTTLQESSSTVRRGFHQLHARSLHRALEAQQAARK